MRIVETIRIERPVEDVWAVVSDPTTHVEWRPALVEFRLLTDGSLAIGSRIREVLSWRDREIVIDDVVTTLDPPRRLGIRGGWKAADFELDFTLASEGEATVATMDWPLYPKSLLMKVATPFLGGAMRRSTKEELALLKAYVERGRRTVDAE